MAMETTQPIREPRNGLAVASLVLGLVSLLLFCVPWISVPAALAAIIMGVVIRRRRAPQVGSDSVTMATVGVVCGSVAIALTVVVLLIAAIGGTFFERQRQPYIADPPRREVPQPFEPEVPVIPPRADDPAGHIVTPRDQPVQRAGVPTD